MSKTKIIKKGERQHTSFTAKLYRWLCIYLTGFLLLCDMQGTRAHDGARQRTRAFGANGVHGIKYLPSIIYYYC